MYSHEAANRFTDHIGVSRNSAINSDAEKMIRAEAEVEIKRGALKRQRNQWDKAVGIAFARLVDWYNHGLDYNTNPLHNFVASHRQACVWAVLLKKHHAETEGREI